MAEEGLDSSTVEIITQDFNMNAFLSGDIDAAQAMTYNEYAQVLETVNPETGELYTADDLNVISYEDTVGAMLQDAIWADTERLESDEEYQETTVAFLKAVIKGWVYAAENPEDAAQITIDAGSGWGPSHELWMVNETNKLIWPAPNGIGYIDEGAFDDTVAAALTRRQRVGREPHHRGARRGRLDERVHRAGSRRARGGGRRRLRRGLRAHRGRAHGGRQLVRSAPPAGAGCSSRASRPLLRPRLPADRPHDCPMITDCP